VRWRIAKKCPCVTENNRHDIHCPKCGGSGDIYDYQREYEVVFRSTVRANIIEIPKEYAHSKILEVYDSRGRKSNFCHCGNFVKILDGNIARNELVDVRIRAPIVKRLKSVMLEKIGGGYYRVPGLLTEPSKFEGVFYQAAGDVISVTGLSDGTDTPVNVLEYRRDTVLVNSNAESLTATTVQYVMPFRFAVLSQNLSKEDASLVNACHGDAVCTFPYVYNLSENDVITTLSGTMTHKIVIEKRGNLDDVIPEFFVAQIDSLETMTSAYKEGEDFVLVGTNNIRWIGARQPEELSMMSITYRYYPTYRVVKDVPMLRTSEDQRVPRKVPLKLFAGFSEAKKVNQNE